MQLDEPRAMARFSTVVVLVALAACGKKGDGAATRAPETQAEVCEKYADDAIRLAKALGKGIARAGGTSAEEQRKLEAELAAELAGDRKELVDECLAWPPSVIECIKVHGALGCDGEIARAARAKVPTMEPGPRPAWTFTLGGRPDHVLLGDDGVVFASIDNRVVAVADGKERWSVPFEDADELRLDGEGAVMVISDSPDVVALDGATGAERWRLTVPGERSVRAWADAGKDLLLATSDGRFFLRPPKCRAAKCLKPAGALPDEDIYDDIDLVVMPDGRRWTVEYGLLRAFGADLTPALVLHGYDFWTGVTAAADGRVIALVGDELVALDPAACGGGAELYLEAPPGKSGDEERCEGCVDPPAGCVLGRSLPADELHRVAPTTAGGSVLVVGDGKLLAREASAGLGERWSLELLAAARPIPLDDGGALVHCEDPSGADAEDTPLALCAVDAAGKPGWRSPLGVKAGMIFGVDDFHLARRGAWVLAGYREQLVLVPAPR